MSKNLPLC
ncbi:hypothetical protein YPPY11_3341, partial [Yersinia pestis PY-11]